MAAICRAPTAFMATVCGGGPRSEVLAELMHVVAHTMSQQLVLGSKRGSRHFVLVFAPCF